MRNDLDWDDPSYVPPVDFGGMGGLDVSEESEKPVRFETLLKTQLTIAGALQRKLCDPNLRVEVSELRGLVSASNQLVASLQRGGEALRALETYRAMLTVVLEFLKRRTDTLGEDLLAELREVARELRQEGQMDQFLHQTSSSGSADRA